MVMTAADVLEVLDRLDDAGIEAWLDGGWAVDAILGEETRPHKDVDLIVRTDDGPKLRETLVEFSEVPEDATPTNFVLRDARGRDVDVHTVRFDAERRGVYRMATGDDWIFPAEGFTGRGRIGDRVVRCLSADVQMLCHATGYEPGDTDFHDMALLHERLGTELLGPYLGADPSHLRVVSSASDTSTQSG